MREFHAREGLDFAVRDIDVRLEPAREDGAGNIHAADLEHHGHGLHLAVGFASLVKRRARGRGDIAVARGIHHHLATKGLGSVFALRDDATHAAIFHERPGAKRVEQCFRAGFVKHFEQHLFEAFGVNGFAAKSGDTTAVEDFLVEPALGVACPMAHEAGCGNAAGLPRLFNEERFRALPSGANRGGKPGGPAAGNDNVVFARDGNLTGGECDKIHGETCYQKKPTGARIFNPCSVLTLLFPWAMVYNLSP